MANPPLLHVHLFLSNATAWAHRAAINALITRLRDHEIEAERHGQQARPPAQVDDKPTLYVSIGGRHEDFRGLNDMPPSDRRCWIHVDEPRRVHADLLYQCWLAATDPLPENRTIGAQSLSDEPLVSVFTAAHRSGDRIHRPYRSLLAQSYPHWEWIVLDDSGDDGATFENWILPQSDPRVRKFLLAQRSGYIGSVKRTVATQCQGEILVELDHDDELTPDCLQRLVDAFRRHPEAGFAFGEATEIYEDGGHSHWYGWDAGFGYLTYWRQFDGVSGRLVNVPRTAGTNWQTVRHLIGLPNHPRAWTRAAYVAAGGHRPGLSVADDYDLILRSLLCTGLVRVPHLLYLQYRNAGGANQTFVRNRQIQLLCGQLERFYRPRIEARLCALGLPDLTGLAYRRIWTCAADDPRRASLEVCDEQDSPRLSRLFVYPFTDPVPDTSRLIAVLARGAEDDWRACEVVVVGQVPEGLLEAAARRAPPGSIRWWSTEAHWPYAEIEQYGRLLCTGQVVLETEVAESVAASPRPARPLPLQYVDAYALATPADRGQDRLTVLWYLRERFGYRRYLEIGTDRDEVFAQMNGFELKVGVDPRAGGTHRMTSDAYFATNRTRPPTERERFDLVLIDGLHEYAQVLRDVDNALECLLPGGTLVLHDCLPYEERQQRVPRPQPMGFWTGDVWKAVLLLRTRPAIDLAVGRFDWGVGVVRPRPNARPFVGLPGAPAQWTWQHYLEVRDAGLNAMGFDALREWIG